MAMGSSGRSLLLSQRRAVKELFDSKILSNCSDGLSVNDVPAIGIGRGLFATKKFIKDDYIAVYTGETISEREYAKRYKGAAMERCYTFHYQHDSKYLVVDATNEFNSVARMANHSWKKFNAVMSRQVIEGKPYLVLIAAKDIEVGHEIRYNYGDEVVQHDGDKYPWLREVKEYN